MLVPHGALILVVDGGKMQLLRNSGRDSDPALELLRKRRLRNPRNHVMGDDAPGRSFQSVGPRRGAHERDDRHQRCEDTFGEQALDTATELAGNAPLIVIAPPHMLGRLRAHRKPGARPEVLAEIAKDLAGYSASRITSFLNAWRP
jgi:protein required for attachment to host cells